LRHWLNVFVSAAGVFLSGAAAARGATVSTIEGKTLVGRLTALDQGALTITTGEGDAAKPETIRLDEVVAIKLDGASEMPPATRPATETQPGVAAETQPASRPADAVRWHVTLLGGDRLTGSIDRLTKTAITLATGATEKPVEVPLQDVKEIWASGSSRKDAAGIKFDDALEDVALVKNEGRVVDVRGTLIGWDDAGVSFRYNGEVRQIDPARLVGLVLVTREFTPADRLEQSFLFTSGDIITGDWIALKDGLATLKTPWNAELVVPLGELRGIAIKNGRLLYVSDMTPIKAEETPYFDRLLTYRVDQALDGGPLIVDGTTYEKGIAVHSRCVLEYALGGKYEKFRARVGFQQPGGRLGRVAVRVLADGKPLFEDADLRGDQKAAEVDVNVAGAKRLTLEVDYGQGQDVGDRVAWADARLLKPAMK
jgi:hypothetical protein